MRNFFSTMIIVAVTIIMGGCRSSKEALQPALLHHSDSTRVEYRERTVFFNDTVFVPLAIQNKETTKKDSISILENDYVTSTVKLNKDGSITHQLNTKQFNIPVKVQNKIEYRDSIIYREKKIEVPVPVERKLSYWQQRKVKWFPWLVSLLAISMGYIFRKPILKLIRRFI